MYNAHMAELTRVTVNLTEKSSRALDWLSDVTSLNRTDIINRSVQLYQYIQSATITDAELYIKRPDGRIELIKILA